MSDIAEGVGGVVEGAITGRAIEPKQGETGNSNAQRKDGECLNCGAQAPANYCSNCGQKTHVHRTLSAIGHDLMHGVLHLDGKLWRTLPMLAFKPGQLTRRYIRGERASFVSPMAMFLFSIFTMFAVFQMVGISAPTDLEGDISSRVPGLVAAERESVSSELTQVEEQLAQSDLDSDRRSALERQRSQLMADLEQLDTRGRNLVDWLSDGGSQTIGEVQSSAQREIEEARERLSNLPEGSPQYNDLAAEIAVAERGLEGLENLEEQAVDTIDGEATGFGLGRTVNETGISAFDDFFEKWNKNPSLMLYKMQANGYKFSWLLIPLSIPFVWLLFAWKRRFKAYDHAIFVTYSLSFMSLLFIALSLIGTAGVSLGWVFTFFATLAPLHIYKHLRHAYDLSRLSTIWRFLALSFFILIVIVFFVQALLLLGAF